VLKLLRRGAASVVEALAPSALITWEVDYGVAVLRVSRTLARRLAHAGATGPSQMGVNPRRVRANIRHRDNCDPEDYSSHQ
jgi:hypothetical protein